MSSKPKSTKNVEPSNSEPQTTTNQTTIDTDTLVADAIKEGRSLIDQGKSKIDAAMAIYRMIETLPQATIVKAFVEGATLTDKGALTYWYNCRRRLARERRGA